MKILSILKKELIGKKLVSYSDIETNDDGSVNVDYYNEEGLSIPMIGEVIVDVGEGTPVDGYPSVRLFFLEENFLDVFFDEDIELE